MKGKIRASDFQIYRTNFGTKQGPKNSLQKQTRASQFCHAGSSAVKCALLLWTSMGKQFSNALVISMTAMLSEGTSNSLTTREKKGLKLENQNI